MLAAVLGSPATPTAADTPSEEHVRSSPRSSYRPGPLDARRAFRIQKFSGQMFAFFLPEHLPLCFLRLRPTELPCRRWPMPPCGTAARRAPSCTRRTRRASNPRNPRHFNITEGGRKRVSTVFIYKYSVPCTQRWTTIVSWAVLASKYCLERFSPRL